MNRREQDKLSGIQKRALKELLLSEDRASTNKTAPCYNWIKDFTLNELRSVTSAAWNRNSSKVFLRIARASHWGKQGVTKSHKIVSSRLQATELLQFMRLPRNRSKGPQGATWPKDLSGRTKSTSLNSPFSMAMSLKTSGRLAEMRRSHTDRCAASQRKCTGTGNRSLDRGSAAKAALNCKR